MMEMPTTLDDLKEGRRVPFNSDDDQAQFGCLPEWYDEGRFKRGQDFFTKYASSVILGFTCALLVGFTVPSLTEALVFTGETDGPEKSLKRYLDTFYHLVSWHVSDLVPRSGKQTRGRKSLMAVRTMHNRVRRQMHDSKAAGDNGNNDKGNYNNHDNDNDDDEHVPVFEINQYDLALTQSGFIGPLILYPDDIGLRRVPVEGLDDYVYFWRFIGYEMGLKDEFNVCSGGLKAARVICRQIEREIIVPGLECPAERFEKMSSDFANGIRKIGPFSKEAYYHLMFPAMGVQYVREMSITDWIYYVFILRLNIFLMNMFSWYRSFTNRLVFRLYELVKRDR